MRTIVMRQGGRALRLLMCAGISALALPEIAWAQQGGGVTPAAMLSSTPTQSFKIGATVRAQYDSNVARAGAAVAAERGLKLADQQVVPTGVLSLVQPIGREAVFLDASAGYSFHARNRRLDRQNVRVGAGVGAKVAICGLTGSFDWSRGLTGLDDTELEVVNNIRDTRQGGLDIACTRPFGLGLTGSVRQLSANNNLLSASDHDQTSGNLGLSYQRPNLGTFTAFGQYTRTTYPNRLSFGSSSGFVNRAFGLTAARQLGGRIQANASVSWTLVDRIHGPPASLASDSGETYRGLAYAGLLSYRVSPRLSADAGFSRQIMPSMVPNGAYQLRTETTLGATYVSNPRLTLQVGASYRETNVKGTGQAVPGALTLRSSRAVSENFGVQYKLNRRIGFVFDFTHSDRKSDNPGLNYVDDRVALTTSFSL